MSTSSSLSLTGTIGGVKISDLITAQDTQNRVQATTLTSQEGTINAQTSALTTLQNSLNTLFASIGTLSKTSLYESKAGSLANPALGTVAVNSAAATNGTWDVNVLQVATSSTYVGQKASTIPSGSATVDTVFGSTAIGTFRVGTTSGGAPTTITISSGETLDQVATALNTAMGALGGSASYDSTTGKFSITGGDSLLLSAGTSSFLQQAQLFNNYSIRSATAGTAGSQASAPFATGSATTMAGYFGSSFVSGSVVLNGVSVNVSSTDTIDQVISNIHAQTGLDAGIVGGRLTINSTTPVSVGAGTGSFFQQAGLAASSATTTTSQNSVGTIDPTAALGGSGGSITINGTTITYSATDTLNTLMQNINNSQAGVVAVYDSFHDRVGFVSDTAGPNAITISGVSGALANMGIVDSGGNEAGSFTAGNSAVVSVNGGASITSSSNTFTSDMLGIAGLTFSAAQVGDTTVNIKPDLATIESTLDAFVVQYNATQTLLSQLTDPNGTSTINADGTTSTTPPGLLVNDSTVNQIGFMLRSIFGSALYGNTSASIRTLSDVGIEGNANDNTATTTDATLLGDALTFHLTDVLNVFANPVNGLYAKFSNLLINEAVGGGSVIGNEITNNNQQINALDSQIAQINERADAQKLLLEQEYANYESTFSTSQSTSSFLNASSSAGANSSASSGTTSGVLG